MRLTTSLLLVGLAFACVMSATTAEMRPAFTVPNHGPPAVPDTLPLLRAGADASDTKATATVSDSVFNLVNNVAGAGILTLSAGMAKGTGWIPSLLTCLVLGTISSHGFCLIGESCRLLDQRDFKGLWARTISPRSTAVVDLIIALMCTAASVIYSGILGDVSKELLSTYGMASSRSSNILAITTLVLLPLGLLKNLSALAFTSILGFASIAYTVMFIVYRFLDGSYAIGGQFVGADSPIIPPAFTRMSLMNMDFTSLVLMSNLGLAYIAHYNAPVYYRELKDKTQFKKVVRIAFGTLTVLYAVVMAAGVATFGDVCQGNILLNYHPADRLSTLGRVATFASILFGFPLAFCGIRDSAISLAATYNIVLPFAPTAAVLLAIVTFIAITVKDISVVVGITGAAMGSMIVYILPSIMYTRSVAIAHGKDSAEHNKAKKNLLMVPLGLFLAVFGVGMTLKGE